jgi:hypothetical protein
MSTESDLLALYAYEVSAGVTQSRNAFNDEVASITNGLRDRGCGSRGDAPLGWSKLLAAAANYDIGGVRRAASLIVEETNHRRAEGRWTKSENAPPYP